MKVKWLDINGFRGIEHLRLEFDEHINVLVGDNGAGKSAILDCLAIIFSPLVARIVDTPGFRPNKGKIFSISDMSNNEKSAQINVSITYKNLDVPWTHKWHRTRKGPALWPNRGEMLNFADSIFRQIATQLDSSSPLAVYYPVNRAVLDIPLRTSRKPFFNQLDANKDALSGTKIYFRVFFEWFRNREDLENEMRRDKRKLPDTQLEAVRKAITSFLPGFSGLQVKRSPLRMVIYKGNEELAVSQLSDGEKCLLAMVGDLARRLAIANPGVKNPLEGSAVVLIDEIDLHLHPSWQRTVVPALERTFNNCQFILTTHSPAILSHVKTDNIFILQRKNGNVEVTKPESAYGRDSNSILENVMGVDKRPGKIKKQLSKLFEDIARGNLVQASKLLENLRKSIGSDPELVKAEVLIHRKNTIGK